MAMNLDEQPWLPHDGGPMPVAAEVIVQVQFLGDETTTDRAVLFEWEHTAVPEDEPGDIIAYRVVQPSAASAGEEACPYCGGTTEHAFGCTFYGSPRSPEAMRADYEKFKASKATPAPATAEGTPRKVTFAEAAASARAAVLRAEKARSDALSAEYEQSDGKLIDDLQRELHAATAALATVTAERDAWLGTEHTRCVELTAALADAKDRLRKALTTLHRIGCNQSRYYGSEAMNMYNELTTP